MAIRNTAYHAQDVQNVVSLDDLNEYSTTTHMTKHSHEHGEASIYPPDALISHKSGQTDADSAPPENICQVLTSQQRPIGHKGNNI
jgi:hypothetical protein